MATKVELSIKPLADRIVIEPAEETEKMRGGLFVPDTAKEKPQQGTVIAVGPGRRNDEGRTEVTIGGDEYLIIKEGSRRRWRRSTECSSIAATCRRISSPVWTRWRQFSRSR